MVKYPKMKGIALELNVPYDRFSGCFNGCNSQCASKAYQQLLNHRQHTLVDTQVVLGTEVVTNHACYQTLQDSTCRIFDVGQNH